MYGSHRDLHVLSHSLPTRRSSDLELIDGVTVRQVGDFTQQASGTIVAGITPTLVRVYRSEVSDGSVLPEPLGPVAGGVYVGYFTTPQALGYTADNSRLDITGNLDLAGKVDRKSTRLNSSH